MSEPGVGHNSLKSITDRINVLEDQKQAITSDISDLYSEAKGSGLNPKALRVVVRRQRADKAKIIELENDVDAYMAALGML